MPYQDPSKLPIDAPAPQNLTTSPSMYIDTSQGPATAEQVQLQLNELIMIRIGIEELIGKSLELELADPSQEQGTFSKFVLKSNYKNT